MIDKIQIDYKEQDLLESLEEMMIDCQDIQNLISTTSELSFELEEVEATKKDELLQKISKQRSIIKASQITSNLLSKKLEYIIEKLMKEKSK